MRIARKQNDMTRAELLYYGSHALLKVHVAASD